MTCLHIEECGGCSFQHLDYHLQLEQKQTIVSQTFDPFTVEAIIPCADPWRYRNKMEFSFSQDKAGEKFLGLILKKGRGKVFNLRECLIAPPWMTECVEAVKSWWDANSLRAYHFHKGEGTLRTLILREGRRAQSRMVMLTVSSDPRFVLTRADIDGFVKALEKFQATVFLRIQQCLKGSPTQFYEMHLCGPAHLIEKLHIQDRILTFKISPTSFFQPNTFQAEILYSKALEMIEPKGHIFDLYAGTATLSMILAEKAEHVTAIEINPHAVFDAKMNAELNGITNLEILCGDVGKLLAEMQVRPDLVVVDPPRTGLDPLALQQILRLQPRQILYISCNPLTQRSNIQALPGYQILKIQPIDQFPHTPHIENIVLLSPN